MDQRVLLVLYIVLTSMILNQPSAVTDTSDVTAQKKLKYPCDEKSKISSIGSFVPSRDFLNNSFSGNRRSAIYLVGVLECMLAMLKIALVTIFSNCAEKNLSKKSRSSQTPSSSTTGAYMTVGTQYRYSPMLGCASWWQQTNALSANVSYTQLDLLIVRKNRSRRVPYYNLVIQWASATRIALGQSTVGLETILGHYPKFTVHGLWAYYFGLTPGQSDPMLHGDVQLVDRAHWCWPDVLLRNNGRTQAHNNKRFWKSQWYKHGTRCPLMLREYFQIAVEILKIWKKAYIEC